MYVSLIEIPQYKISLNFIHCEPICSMTGEQRQADVGETDSLFTQLLGEGT